MLKHHFKLFEAEVVRESVSSGVPLDEIVLMRSILLEGSVEMDSVPTI